MEESSAGGSGLIGTLGRAIYALISLTTRTILRFGLTTALIASVVITLHAAGQFSKQAVQHRQDVLDLVYWRDPKKSGVVLGVTVLGLLVFAKFPLVAVLSYLGLAVLGGTLGFRLYKLLESQIKKTDGTNPFQPYLNREFHVPQDKVHQQVDVFIEHAQLVGNELRRLFLVENILDSVKAMILCITNCILVVLTVFTVPKVYEVYQEPIDRNVSVAKQHVDNVTKKINDKVPPFLKKSVGAAAGDASHEKSN
ncbi:unnamed protein product [Gongylonema pulchrum]|uniref:Reticulon-like protein n=1 Tax=Gongylonema pulchrum TaxID=637853 RepID=A0A183DNU4_9BILA|nr:unnamed protein product [Gongylonema pulchrum]